MPKPFTGQIELDSWSWEIKNRNADTRKKDALDEKTKEKGGDPKAPLGSKENPLPFKPDGLIRQVADLQIKSGLGQPERDKKVQELIKRAVQGYATEADKDGGRPDEMVLKFEKGTDLATTPLLYALAKGDVIPKVILDAVPPPKNAPVTLAITMSDVRITNYEVSCSPDEKMSDVVEKWEATYQNIDWMYQNRPAASGPNFVTQGTVRVFAMQQKLLPF